MLKGLNTLEKKYYARGLWRECHSASADVQQVDERHHVRRVKTIEQKKNNLSIFLL